MAKIAVLCFIALCVFHVSTGARIVRDVETQDAQKAIDSTLQQLSQFFEQTFSKQNIEKIGDNLKKFGEEISERGKELVQKADSEIKKLQASDAQKV